MDAGRRHRHPADDRLQSDTFETATGWTINPNGTDTATTGAWERGDPAGHHVSGVTKQLGTTVCGTNDLVTGALAGSSAGDFDVDGGVTSVRSPADHAADRRHAQPVAVLVPGPRLNNSSSADYFRVSVVAQQRHHGLFTQAGAASNRDGAWATGPWNITRLRGPDRPDPGPAADASGASLVEAGVDNVTITRG